MSRARRDAENQRLVDVAIAAGTLPRQTAGQTTLPLGQRRDQLGQVVLNGDPVLRNSSFVVLAGTNGQLTTIGEYYYRVTGTVPNGPGLDRSQQLIHRNGSDYVRNRAGQERLVRTLRPDGTVTVTALGQSFFAQNGQGVSEQVIHVPVFVTGTRANGIAYSRETMLPVNQFGLGQILSSNQLTSEQREAEVKRRVMATLMDRGAQVSQNGRQVLMQISGESYEFEADGGWLVSSLETTIGPNGEPVTTANLRQPLTGLPLMGARNQEPVSGTRLRDAQAFLPFHEHILPEAFEPQDRNDHLCVPRQLAILLDKPLADMVLQFDELTLGEAWRYRGLTSDTLKAFCTLWGHKFIFISGNRINNLYEPAVQMGRTIACCAFDGHMYFYKSARCLQNYPVATIENTTKRNPIVQSESRSTAPDISEWKCWPGFSETLESGHYWCSDLAFCRDQLMDRGTSPKVALRNGVEIGSLSFPLGKNRGSVVIRQEIQDEESIHRWLEKLPRKIKWCGERLPALAAKVLMELLKAHRQTPSQELKAELLKQQEHNCAECGGAFDNDIEWDHVTPLRQICGNAPQEFQALCATCHLSKTELEGKADRTLTSRFSMSTWNSYVATPRPPPLVWNVREFKQDENTFEIDVRRCRRNAMAFSAHEFPIFSPFDNVTPSVDGVLCDFTFLKLKVGRRGTVSLLPYVGPMWYHRCSVEFLLHHGIAKWDECLFSLQASSHAPKDCLRTPLQQMDAAWDQDDEHLAKVSVNSLVGLWASTQDYIFSVITSRSECDGAGAYCTRNVKFGTAGETTTDHIFQNKLLQNSSMRPIHDLIMATEATRLAQMLYAIKVLGVPIRCLKCVKTDAIVFQGYPQKCHQRLQEFVENTSFSCLPGLRRTHEKVDANQSFFDDNGVFPKGCVSENRVFQSKIGASVQELKGIYRTPQRDSEPPLLPETGWKDLTDVQEAEATIMRGEGLLLTGAPGTGKTWLLRELIVKLRLAGKIVDVVAKTHSSVQNVQCDAKTADHWIRKHIRNGSTKINCLVVEEVSQINVHIWAELALLQFKGVQFILCGDFQQFQACNETWGGCPVPEGSLENSHMLLEMACGNRFTLTENRRSDQRLFDFYTSLHCGLPEARELLQALEDAKSAFPDTGGPVSYTLTMSHSRRVRVNRAQNQSLKPASGAVFIRAPATTRAGNQPQSMWIWPGIQLIGAGFKSLKGLFYRVESMMDDVVFLNTGQKMTHKELVKSMRLPYALTYASCQGLTLPGRLRLETGSPNMTLRHLYVGVSRATAADLVEVI